MRESRTVADGQQNTTNFFYCPGFDDKNALNSSTNCNGSGILNSATGHTLSRHAHSDDILDMGSGPVLPVGVLTDGGWAGKCDHWLDYVYTPYLLTGDYHFLEEEYYSASFCLDTITPGTDWYQGHRFFSFVNSGQVIRTYAWSLQTIGRAAFIAPDGTPEANYYLSMLNSNLEAQEGVMGVTGTTLTPTSTNPTCTGFSLNATNRWDLGRCGVMAGRTPLLHIFDIGDCSGSLAGVGENGSVDPTKASSLDSPWMYHMATVVLAELREMGFSQAAGLSSETQKSLEEKVGDSTYNPFLVGSYRQGIRSGDSSTTCNNVNDHNFLSTTDPFFATYAAQKASFFPQEQNRTQFDNVNACTDHGYPLMARAAASFLQEFGTSSSDANCPGATCTASATWNWLQQNVPYFNNNAPGGGCGTSDQQIKFALTPR